MPSYKAFWVTTNYNTFTFKDPTTNSDFQFFSLEFLFPKNFLTLSLNTLYILAKMTYRGF